MMKYDAGDLFYGDYFHLLKAARFIEMRRDLSLRVAAFTRDDGAPDEALIVRPKDLVEDDVRLREEVRYYKFALIYLTRHFSDDSPEEEAAYAARQLIELAMQWKKSLFTKAEMQQLFRYLDDTKRWQEMSGDLYKGLNEAYKARDWSRFRAELVLTMEAWEKVKRQVAAWKGAKTRKAKAKSAA